MKAFIIAVGLALGLAACSHEPKVMLVANNKLLTYTREEVTKLAEFCAKSKHDYVTLNGTSVCFILFRLEADLPNPLGQDEIATAISITNGDSYLVIGNTVYVIPHQEGI